MKPNPPLDSLILTLRQQKVILDADLAGLYGVPTKRLNEAVKRNAGRFPADFMFRLAAQECSNLKSQIATSNVQSTGSQPDEALRSQFATLKGGRGQHRKYLPYAFTE
ncbi:MAG: ORF6N domain-containing protein, partial [Verrucomicrobia bacterium]|nr:ORF6N domain-containing protein [Verrucomicrobiota bacterium]